MASLIDIHSSTVNGIELVLDVARSSWRSLPSSSARIGLSLHGWSRNLKLSSRVGNQVLCLVTARLNNKALINLVLLSGIDGLPGILCTVSTLASIGAFPLAILLVN